MSIKMGLEFMPPVLFAVFRYALTAVGLLGYAAAATGYWRPRTRTDWTAVAISGAFIIALYNAFLFVGQQGVTSGVAATLIGMNPVLATGFSRLLLPDEGLGVVESTGLVLGFVGVGLVARPDLTNLPATDLLAPGFVLLKRQALSRKLSVEWLTERRR